MRSISSEQHCCLLGVPASWVAGLVVLLVVAVALPGCGGCRKKNEKTEAEKEAERLAKEREAEKPDFEIASPVSQPSGAKQLGCRYKPGHWTSTIIEAKANKDDFVGEMEISLVQDKGTRPIGLDAVPYCLTDWRPVALAKGRLKALGGSFHVPPTSEIVSGRLRLGSRHSYRRVEVPFLMNRMLAYQYHFVVLARAPDRYNFVRSLDSIRPPGGGIDNSKADFHYWVALLSVDRQTPLPDGALFWTSIAYVLWDDVEPKSLSPAQRRALVDWLHWGGQLIVSGPDTLDTLRDSFLADYLPATPQGAWELKPADFDELNKSFTLAEQRPLAPVGRWSGIRLRLASGAQFIPGTGRLMAERRVGRGRIVVSAVRLSDRSLVDWPGFDGFFNACLLRRPSRQYGLGEYDEKPVVRWADGNHKPDAAALTCKLRYFSRDAGVGPIEYTRCGGPQLAAAAASGPGTPPGAIAGGGQAVGFLGIEPLADGTGVAAWRSFSPVANRARAALQTAACIEVPGRWFVIWIIAAYLAVLVPLNWFIFGIVGKTEWAWAAAPVIAIACTFSVIHLARLDVGFARSETSVGGLEIQGSYPRAHLTRFTAMYTSLTTQYEFSQEDSGTLVQPFPAVNRRDEFRMLPGETLSTLEYWHGKGSRLRGFSIPSNVVDFIHAEQMMQMDGPLEIVRNSRGAWDLVNRTGMTLRGVGVVRRSAAGRVETAWVGQLRQMGSASLTFVRAAETKAPWWPGRREEDRATRANATKGETNVRALTDMAEEADDLRPGEMRLVGWTDAPLGDLKIEPAAPQSRQVTLVVAHLLRAAEGPPEADKNSIEQLKKSTEPRVIEGP